MRSLLWVLVPLAVAAGAPFALPVPFAFSFAALAVLCFRRAARGGGRLALVAGGALVALAVAELALPGPGEEQAVRAQEGGRRASTDNPWNEELGFAPPRGRAIPADEMAGNWGYDGVYTTDAHGLRVTPASEAQDRVLFFGGSYTFGLNVADEEVMAWRVGAALADTHRVHNFGFGGYGPHQMLAALEAGYVDEVVGDGAVRHVFFQLIDNHVRRVVGNTTWSLHDPRYAVVDGRAVRAGRFSDPPPEPSLLERALARSAIWREATSHTFPRHVDTLVEVLATARDEAAERWPGARFHVLCWDKDTWKTRRMLSGLEDGGIDVLLVSDVLPGFAEDYDSWFKSEADHHPSAAAHARLAEAVVAVVRDA